MADDDGIVWDEPVSAPSTARAPDKDGIVWDDPTPPEGGDDKTGFLSAFGSGVQGGLGSGALAYQAAYPYLSGTGMASKKADAALDQYRAEKAAEAKAALPAGVTPFTGEGSGDFFRALRENAGASLPYAIPGVLGAIAGGPLGAGLATYPLVAGSNLEAQIDNYGYVKDPGTAFAAAVPQTAAEVAFGMLPIAKIFRGGIGEVVAKATANPLSKFSFGVGKQMLGEGSTEVFQQSLERWQAGLPVGNDDAKAAYLESFVAGAVLGSVPGAVEGGLDAYADKRANAKKILEDRTLLDAVNELKNSQSEEIRARAVELQNQINESRRLLLAPPPKTIGGKPFGGEDIIEVARKNPDLVPGWSTILESPDIKTVDEMRQALLRAAGQQPKPNIQGQRYDTEALAASGAQSETAELLRRQQESMVPPATTEQMAAGVNSPFAGLSDDQIVAKAEQNRGQNPELDAILDQPIGNVQKAAAIVAKYQESYGPEYETLAGISDLPITSPYTAPTLASPNQLTFLQQQQQEQQDALERMRVARQEAQAALLAAASETGVIRGRTDEGTGGAGQAAMDLAAQPPLYGNVPYEGPNDALVTNYIRNLPPNTPPSVALITSELGLTVPEAQDAIRGNTGQNRLLVMRMGVPTTRPKRRPGAPDTTASSPRGAATNTEDMTGTRNTSGSETAGGGTAPTQPTAEPFRNKPIDRLNRFISRIPGGGVFNFNQAQVGSRGGRGESAATKSQIDARMQELVDSGEYIRYDNGIKKIATEDDVRRIIEEAPNNTKVTVRNIAEETGLPFDTVASVSERYRPDPSAPITTRGQVRQSENTLVETGTPFEFWKNGPPPASGQGRGKKGSKTQRSVAGSGSPNLDRVLAEAAAKSGETQSSPAAPQAEATSLEDDIAPTPRLGGKTRLEDLGGPAETTQQAPPAGGAKPQQEAPKGASGSSAGTNAYAPSNKERLAKSRKVVAEKLRQLRVSGKVGAEVANKISQLLKDPNFDAEQIIRAFGVADALSKTFGGTDANPRVEFHQLLTYEDQKTKKLVSVAGEAAAADAGVRGLIKISLSKDLSASLVRDTAFHEGFHFLQDMIDRYDPKTAEFLFGKRTGTDPDNGRGIYSGGAFRDGMTLADIDPSIKRVLQNAAPEKGGPSYWDILKRRYDSSESLRSDFADQREAVAYVFGALADAQNNGHQLGGLKPAFRRFLNFLTQFAQNLRNVFRGYGYTNTNQILSEFAAGKKQKGYGRDIEGDFSGSTGDRQSQRAIDEDLKAAKSQGVDTSNIPEVRKAGELQRFATDFNKKMSERTQEVRAKIRQLREEGKLPFDIGTKFTTEQSRSSGQPPYTVTGYTVGKTMDEYGYRLDQGSPNDENYTQTSIDVSNPRIDKKYKEEYGMPDFDRQKIVDGFRVLGGPMRTMKPQRAIAGDKEAVPEGTTKVGINADIRRLIDLFGPKMYSSGMAHVTAKELLQNSFDGVKSAYASGALPAGGGNIGFVSDRESRSILITDNGAGMSPEIVRDAFLTLAGTNKEGLSAGEASGGFGVAKMAFIFGNKRLILNTVKDGVRTTLDTNGEELLNGVADINVEPTDDAPGTSVLITVPETYTTDNGSEEEIFFPTYTGGFEIFQQPLLGDVAIYEADSIPDVKDFDSNELRDYSRNLISMMEENEGMGGDRYVKGFFRTKKGRFSELEDTPLMTTARFPWGDIQIYYGNEKQRWGSKASVLSSGLYQFNKAVPKIGSMYESIPYNVILNVRPRVKAESSEYPFNKQREDFNRKIDKDIGALIRYLGKIAWNRDALDVGSNFADIKTIRNVSFFTPEEILNDRPIAEFLVETGDPELRQHIPKAKKQDLSAEFVDVRDGKVTGNGRELAAEDEKSEEKDENAQLDLNKYLIPNDLVPSGPVLHNNLNVDPIEETARRTGEDPLLLRYFAYRVGSIFYNFAQRLGSHPNHFHWNAVGHPVGISFDKEYHGVHVKVPFKGMFINPASAEGDSVKSIAASFLHTMMHEATHDVAGGHSEKFTMSLAKLYSYVEDVAPDLIDKTTEDLRTLVREYETQFKALRGTLHASDVTNVESDETRTGQRIGGRDQGDTENTSRSGSSAERRPEDVGRDNAGNRGREGGEGLRRGAEKAGGVKGRKAKVQRAWAGESSTNWQYPVQNAAEAMEASGMKWQDIYWNTGLHRGENDGRWRSEIPDVDAKINDKELNSFVFDPANYGRVKLSVVYYHPDIYDEYPFLMDVYLIKLPSSKDTKVSGSADIDKKEIGVAIDLLEDHLLGSKAKYPDEVRKILTHEIQHFIQDTEGFDGGSSESQVISVSKNMASDILGLINNAYYNKVKDPLDDLAEKANRYLLKDLKAEYPDLRIDLKNFISGFGLPEVWKVDGAKVSQVRDMDLMNKVLKHPDFKIADKARDLLEEGARAVEAKNELVQTTLDELTPEKARERYLAAYGERESRDTEERLKLVTKEQRRATLPGSLDETVLTIAGQYVFEDPEFDVFEKDEFLNDVRDQINDLSDKISGKKKPKTQRSIAGESDAYASEPKRYFSGDPRMQRAIAAISNTPLTQDVYHGTEADFNIFKDQTGFTNLSLGLGVHVSRDPLIAGNEYFTNRMRNTGGRVLPLKTFPDSFFYEVRQDLLPGRSKKTKRTPKTVRSDDRSIANEMLSVAFKEDPELFKSFLVKDKRFFDASKIVKDFAEEGRARVLGVDYDNIYDLVQAFLIDTQDKDKLETITRLFRKSLIENGYAGVKYINTSGAEVKGSKDPICYVILPEVISTGHFPIRSRFAKFAEKDIASPNIQRSISGDDEPGIASEMSKDLERIREAGGRRTFITTGKALNRMADIISTKFDAKGTLPHKDLLRVMMNMANGNIKIIEEKANERRLIIDSGTKEQRAAIYKYLTTKGGTLPNDLPENLRDAAKGAKADIINVGRQIVDKGILTKEQIAANEGQYLPRMYMQYFKDAAGFGTGSYRLSKQDYTKKKQDIPEDIRTAKGEILEPGFPYMKAAVLPARDAAIIDFLSDVANTKGTGWVAENSIVDWRGTKVSPFWLSEQMRDIRDNMLYEEDPSRLAVMKKVADQMQTIIDKTDMRGDAGENYERLPNTARYGALRGMAVRKEIHEAVVGMGNYAGDMSDFERVLGRGVNFWKLTKTVFNPGSHFRQIYSNMIVADMSGISMPMIPVRMVQAIGDILGDKGAWKIAKENGITATGMVDYELRQALDDLKTIAKATPAGKILSAIPINEWSKKWLRRINPVNLYQWEDYIFKVIKIKDEMEKYEKRLGPARDAKEQKLRESASVLEANEWFMDYSDVHRFVKRARESFYGAPFITYQYKIAPRIAETVLKRPWRMVPYIGLYWALPALAASHLLLDDDDLERLKKSMKEYLRLNPSALPLPWLDERRNFQFLDVGYLFPWSYMTNLANTIYQSATGNATPTDIVKATGALGNPILTGLSAALSNIDSFTGKEIINKYDVTGDKVKDFLGYVWGQLAPPFLTNYGPIGGPIADWFSGNRGDIDRKGNPRRSEAQLMAQFFGFNIYPVNPEQQFAQNVMLMDNDIKRAQANLTQELNNKTLSAENRRALIDKRMPDIKRRMQKMQEYIRDARPTERLRNR